MRKTTTRSKFTQFFTCMCLIWCLAAHQSRADTITVSWTDDIDATQEIQDAIIAAGENGTVIIPYIGKDYLVSDIGTSKAASNKSALVLDKAGLTLKLEQGVVLRAKHGGNHYMSDQGKLISIKANGVTVEGEGSGASLIMNRAGYQVSPYVISQFRHAIKVHPYNNILVKNLSIEKAGGDGIAIGKSKNDMTSPSNVTIDNVHVIDPTRLGISITSGDGITVRNSVFEGAKGENPESGIDIEPNHDDASQVLKDILVENCEFNNNNANGIKFTVFNYYDYNGIQVQDLNIIFRNCKSLNNEQMGIKLGAVKLPHINDGPKGTMVFQNIEVDGSGQHGLYMGTFNVDKAPSLSFEGCTFKNVGQDGTGNFPIWIQGQSPTVPAGNMIFKSYNNIDCQIVDKDFNRPIVSAQVKTHEFKDITGIIKADVLTTNYFDMGDGTNWDNMTLSIVPFNAGGGSCSGLPDEPGTLSAVVDNCNQVSLSWGAANCADSYVVRRWIDPATKVTIGTVTGTSFTDNTVAANETYTYLVRATNNSGQTNSNTPVISTGSCGSSGGGITGKYYYLVNKDSGLKMRIPNCSSDYSGAVALNLGPVENTSDCVQFQFIESNPGYYYIQNKGTNGRYQPAGGSTLTNGTVNIVQVSNSEINQLVQWEVLEDGNGYYRFQNRSTGEIFKPQACGSITGTAMVQVSNAQNVDCTKWSLVEAGTANRQMNDNVSIENTELNLSPTSGLIYPNPTSGMLYLDTKEFVVRSLSISNLSGQVQYSGSGTDRLNVSSLVPGVYLLTMIKEDNHAVISRFIKQ
ncbi:T9SS type A sorting domain-containing protein [Reichenbachiella carrageenanivorans]|uniref:T9SS type A sorting domain-containing protein n=1 Tax=Reichenbachiella carrageenanivorans TaxID=2979869 RepID=A0ABY6D4B9_9BACT|nr:right-handed parallel beta-helix repeat-containing protein [Reichenbachiella carrageenanivorans]UXX80992.1 T9SS type A sorting domain-containing protein [Reichenbachiella carrageenanivorans]